MESRILCQTHKSVYTRVVLCEQIGNHKDGSVITYGFLATWCEPIEGGLKEMI